MSAAPQSDDAGCPAPPSGPEEPSYRRLAAMISQRHRVCLLAAAFPFVAGTILYGWRGAAGTLLLMATAALAARLWKRVGVRGSALAMPQVLWYAMLLGLMLPPHLLSHARLPLPGLTDWWPWTIVPAAGLLLVICLWLLGGRGLRRVHPLVLTLLVLLGLFHAAMTPHEVLTRDAVVTGDLSQFTTALTMPDEPWVARTDSPASDALWYESTAAERLAAYTSGRLHHGMWHSIDSLLRDALPPLEDLVIGGHPGAFGTSSAIGVLVAGLFLMYRRVIVLRMPVVVILVAWMCFLILPVPAVIGSNGPLWRPLVAPRAHQDLSTIITFANYELMASPLLFVAFFLAPMSGICPRSAQGRLRFAFLLGVAIAASQLYLSVSFGPYLALGIINLLSPTLDGSEMF